VEVSVALLVACLPVIGGRMISRWRHIFRHEMTPNISVSQFQFHSGDITRKSVHDAHEMGTLKYGTLKYNSPFIGTDGGIGIGTVETTISGGLHGSTSKESVREDEPVSLLHNMVRMGRRDSMRSATPETQVMGVTVRKEVYISEETSGDRV
jgi:hypothetical protein